MRPTTTARVEAQADLEVEAAVTPQPVAVGGQGALDAEGRVQRADGVVLVGDGGPEERHETVAEELVNGALVAVNLGQHHLEGAVHELVDVLGVETLGERGEAGDVDEEDGDLLALALEGALRGEDLLGEVARGIRLGRRRSPRGSTDGLAALQTELRAGRQRAAALGARGHKRAPAFQAELRRRRVLVLAPGTVHAPTSPRGVSPD